MNFYYNFNVLSGNDFEYEVSNAAIVQYLIELTGFTKDEVESQFDHFVHLYYLPIHNHFRKNALSMSNWVSDPDERPLKSQLQYLDHLAYQRCNRKSRKKLNKQEEEYENETEI